MMLNIELLCSLMGGMFHSRMKRCRRCKNKQECIPVGCVTRASMVISGGAGVSTRGEGVHPLDPEADTPMPMACWDRPPRTEFLTHAYENITFPQLLLLAVKIKIQCYKFKLLGRITIKWKTENNYLFCTPVRNM